MSLLPVIFGCALAGLCGTTACGAAAGAPILEPSLASSAPPTGGGHRGSGAALDGAALYAEHCASCHGDAMKGSSARATQKAIDDDVGHMGRLKNLTTAEVAAIAATP